MSGSPPSYSPAPYLVKNSLLTVPQLISHFRDFYTTLEYVSHAPALVFERLVTNLEGDINTTFEQERSQHTIALEKYRSEVQNLQASNSRLEKELTGWKELAMLKEKVEPVMKSKTISNPVIGTFCTDEVRSGSNPQDRTSKGITFTRPYSAPPGLPIGLTILDFWLDANIRVIAHAGNIRKDRFDINMDARDGTRLYYGGCTWLEVESGDLDFQFGTFNSEQDRPHTHSTNLITFPRPYSVPPRVVVWLTTLDIMHEKDWRIKTYETNITATGFTIHIETWGNTELHPTIATWVAYPADKPNVFSGKISTEDMRSSKFPQTYNSGYVNFGNVFTSPPRVLVAFNSLEMGCTKNLRLRVKTSNVSATGMTWHLDSWDDSILYSAGASYIALG